MKPELIQQLKAIADLAGKGNSFASFLEHAQLLSNIHVWTAEALSQSHLVEVAAALNRQFQISLPEMSLLDVPVDVLTYFPGWENGSQEGFRPAESGLIPPSVGGGEPFKLLRLQLSPFSTTLSAALLLLRRLLEAADEETRFQVAVEPGGSISMLQDIIAGFHPTAKQRVQLFELQTSSIFAQDNARGALRKSDLQSVLMIPRSFRQERDRSRDDLSTQLKDDIGELPIFRSALFWEGGNITHDHQYVFIGSDTIQENMVRLGLTREQVEKLFECELGREICVLGDVSRSSIQANEFRNFNTGQASFHIDLDMCPLGVVNSSEEASVLLASPEISLPLIPKILEEKKLIADHYLDIQDAKKLIEYEYRAYAEKRIESLSHYRNLLTERGYAIVDVPDLRIDPDHNLFSTRNLDFIYCNVLCGSLGGRDTIAYIPYGVSLLDSLAEKSFKNSGCEAHALSKTGRLANLLMLFRGGLRCACSQVR